MKWEHVSLCVLTVFLTVTFSMSLRVQVAEASETIYIRANGLVEGTDKIVNANNVTYTFTDNINDSIVVEKDNIVVDGAGYTVQGSGSGYGFNLTSIINVTIQNANIKNFGWGIYLGSSSNSSISGNNITANNYDGIRIYSSSSYNTISGNSITANNGEGILLGSSSNNTVSGNSITANNYDGIYLDSSSNNTVSGNNITNNDYGIELGSSSNNTVSGNSITANNYDGIRIYSSSSYNTISGNSITANNYDGIYLDSSSNSNRLYHNNIINNTVQAYIYDSYSNVWDDGYPSGGNYWSNYTGVDLDHDGIGDSPHVIDANNTDNYPLMGMFSDFQATSEHHIQTISNSTISNFQFNGTAASFNVSGGDGTIGFCRICIPTALMNITYKVFVNGTEVSYTLLPFSNSTHSYLYFTYNHSTQEVIIIPEFPSFLILPLFMLASLLAAVAYRRKIAKSILRSS